MPLEAKVMRGAGVNALWKLKGVRERTLASLARHDLQNLGKSISSNFWLRLNTVAFTEDGAHLT